MEKLLEPAVLSSRWNWKKKAMLETYWTNLLDPKDPLFNWRQKGWDLFEKIGYPIPKQEAFQYLSKTPVFPDLSERPNDKNVEEPGTITFVDGFFVGALLAKPLICTSMSQAMLSYGLFLQSRLAKLLKEETDPLAALNGAFYGDSAFLYVPPKCKAALQLHQIFTGKGFSNSRIHIYLGRGAELDLVQISKGAGVSNCFLDFVLDDGAKLAIVDQAEGHFQSFRASLKRDSKLKAVFLGEQIRNSIRIQLAEENSEAEVYGLSRLDGEKESHVHALIEHISPHTRSRQHFKSVLKDKSRFSFEGKIYVKPAAQKTEAYQLNNNLILSEDAAGFAKPNLEIFADDVKASHGATTGQLDEEMLFYLRSRGLKLEQAKEWLIDGFCKEILDHAR
jgi:Fe-S cluster assembly protein SufD